MTAGRYGVRDQLLFADLVIGAAGVAKPPAQDRARCLGFDLFDFDGAQLVGLEADPCGQDGSVEETPCRPGSNRFGS